ncbi:MAG: hypothetical protein J6N49_04575 [Alphaproteobacteria bacterium]|nr:hypothetical protein [Alphaproteobacteria bacterium]
MKKKKIWQFVQVCAVVFVMLGFCSCQNDDGDEAIPSSRMQSELVFQTRYGTDCEKTPFECNEDFLFLQWYLTDTYVYFSSVDGKRDTLTADPMACVLIKIEDGTEIPQNQEELTQVRELSSGKYVGDGEDDFVWYENLLSVGSKVISVRWGSDVAAKNSSTNIVFPYLEFTKPLSYSCKATPTNELNDKGQQIYRVDFETMQNMYIVASSQNFSEREVYRFHWFFAL